MTTVYNRNGIEFDTDEIVTDINKLSRAYIVENYVSGTSWYRVYSDGFCEQGGEASNITDTTITFLKPFINTNYNVVVGAYDAFSPDDNQFCTVQWRDKTTTTVRFQAAYQGVLYGTTIDWRASGYISIS